MSSFIAPSLFDRMVTSKVVADSGVWSELSLNKQINVL